MSILPANGCARAKCDRDMVRNRRKSDEMLRTWLLKRKTLTDITNAVGLIDERPGSNYPKFRNEHCNALWRDVTSEARSFLENNRGITPGDLRTKAAEEGLCSDVGEALAEKYGALIWGEGPRHHLFRAKPNDPDTAYTKDLYYHNDDDKFTIQFFLRCWVLKKAIRNISPAPQQDDAELRPLVSMPRRKSVIKPPSAGMSRLVQAVSPDTTTTQGFDHPMDLSEDVEPGEIVERSHTDLTGLQSRCSAGPSTYVNGSATTAHVAPFARMWDTPQPSQDGLQSVGQTPGSDYMQPPYEIQDDPADLDYIPPEEEPSSNDIYSATVPRKASPQRNKRRRMDKIDTGNGKLRKVTSPKLPRERPRTPSSDLYAVPPTPPHTSKGNRLLPFRDRSPTASSIVTGSLFNDSQVSTVEPDPMKEQQLSEIIENAKARASHDENARAQIYRPEPHHDESLFVPSQTQSPVHSHESFRETINVQPAVQTPPEDPIEDDHDDDDQPLLPTHRGLGKRPVPSFTRATTVVAESSRQPVQSRQWDQPIASTTPTSVVQAMQWRPFNTPKTPTTRLRKQLFVLLLSRLENSNDFAPDAPSDAVQKAEAELDCLLNSFWRLDTESLAQSTGARFTELQWSFDWWLSLRRSVRSFCQKVSYSNSHGSPNSDDLERHMEMVPNGTARRQAWIARTKMKVEFETVLEEEAWMSIEVFNRGLAECFQGMTRVFPEGKGVQEFEEAVQKFNEGLFGWFT